MRNTLKLKTESFVDRIIKTPENTPMNDWNEIYREKGVVQKDPSPYVLAAIEQFAPTAETAALDLGCGTGRHLAALLATGCSVFGCDTSSTAVETARKAYPDVNFAVCDMTHLPYSDHSFDIIISNNVLQHGTMEAIQQAFTEIKRVLKPYGRAFLSVTSTEHPKAQTGYEIEPGTRMDTDALDGHIPHHFFTDTELESLLAPLSVTHSEHVEIDSDLDPGRQSATWIIHAAREG
jgi:SAM-dependent methyltransferase